MEKEQNIHWDKKDPEKLDLEYYETIGTFVKWFLWGGIAIALVSLLGIFTTNLGVLGIVAILLRSVLVIVWCVKARNALSTRKENAIFLTRSLVWFLLISWILNCIANLVFSNITQVFNIPGIIWLAGCIGGLVNSYSDGDMLNVFPKSFRCHSRSDLLLVLGAWIIPNVIEFIGVFVKAL